MGEVKKFPVFTENQLMGISEIISEMLSHSEITKLLIGMNLSINDVQGLNKSKRIFNALAERQNEKQTGNTTLVLISNVFDPVKYNGQENKFSEYREKLNYVLAFYGMKLNENGRWDYVKSANNINEAKERASRLKESVLQRNLHPFLLEYCKEELVQSNYFHAVLEATKSIASKIRQKTNLTSDGAKLIDEAFGGENPILKINDFKKESEKSEQRGFINLSKGLFGTFRNPTAHAAKVEWDLKEEDALDLFTLASYILRRLDRI